ncbi:hemophore-related protein [Nocardia sp. NPDC050712]|uniref:hemophore-related protein n=1 Tax=Nocardia sp. NPDC050712 TaxID=3155518 RepID=UPI0033EE86CD
MKAISIRKSLAATAMITGLCAAASTFGIGAANADPMSDLEPLLSSNCSFTQIDAALHEVSPETAAQLDAAPAQKDALKTAYDQPVEQRRAAFQTLIEQQQKMGISANANADFAPKMSQVVDSCNKY